MREWLATLTLLGVLFFSWRIARHLRDITGELRKTRKGLEEDEAD